MCGTLRRSPRFDRRGTNVTVGEGVVDVGCGAHRFRPTPRRSRPSPYGRGTRTRSTVREPGSAVDVHATGASGAASHAACCQRHRRLTSARPTAPITNTRAGHSTRSTSHSTAPPHSRRGTRLRTRATVARRELRGRPGRGLGHVGLVVAEDVEGERRATDGPELGGDGEREWRLVRQRAEAAPLRGESATGW